jgi:hypothetical protein
VGRDTVPGGGAADRREREERARARGCADARGPAREERDDGPPGCTVPFWICLNLFEIV